jgi:ComF family protein
MFGGGLTGRRLGAAIVRSVFPDLCVFCGGDAFGYFCFNCRADLPRTRNPCGRCNEPQRAASPGDVDCASCQLRPPPFYRARAAVLYAFPVNAALKSLKFGHTLYYVPAFAELLLAEFLLWFGKEDALVPVPLHHLRYAARGFNQAAELCKPLSRATGLPILLNVRRTRRTLPQSGLDAVSRRKNLQNAFAVRGTLGSRHPLIIDDVMTTGETCRQLALTLLRAGAMSVGVLTVARAAVTRPLA